MITAGQLRAARALLGIDQKTLADHAGLSTPTIQTLDNEEAKFLVGQNIPLITGSYANAGGSNIAGVSRSNVEHVAASVAAVMGYA